MLNPLEFAFLSACHELVKRQQELVPILAKTLGVGPSEVFYRWMDARFPGIRPALEQEWLLPHSRIPGTDWEYFFHGFECDLRHSIDGRTLRVEFGPRGRIDTFGGYAVLQFVMTSKPPWTEFPDLRDYLAEKPPPYDRFSGSHARMRTLWMSMAAASLVEPAAPELYALVEAHTETLAGGHQRINLPEDLSARTVFDCLVCQRSVLSEMAYRTLAEGQPPAAS